MFLRDRIREHKEQGLAAYRAGRFRDAKAHFAALGGLLLKLAERSDRSLRPVHVENAKQFVALAKGLDAKIAAAGPASRGGPAKGTRARPAEDAADRAAEDDTRTAWKAVERPKVRFSDVAGLEDVKDEIRARMIYPFLHPEKAKKYGVRRGGGMLLYGPPGTGKTLLARAIAGELDAAFFSVKPSEILSKWVGEAEQNVRGLFDTARAEARAVIFIDEIESLVPKRASQASTVMARVVPELLAALEGFEGRSDRLLFVGATNIPWALDSAVLRPGRFDVKVYLRLPDAPARAEILRLNLTDTYVAEGLDLPALAAASEGLTGADLRAVCERVSTAAFLRSVKTGVEERITAADLSAAIAATKPSVAPADLKRYEEWGRSHG